MLPIARKRLSAVCLPAGWKRPVAAPTPASSAEVLAEHVVVEDDVSRAATFQELQSHGFARARFCCWCEVPRADICQQEVMLQDSRQMAVVLRTIEEVAF